MDVCVSASCAKKKWTCSRLSAPAPRHRFGTLLARALDLANEASRLGQAMLAAIEKHDAEQALASRFDPAALDGLALSPEGLNSDIHANADYRAHCVVVMAKRAVAAAAGKA